MLTFTMTTAAWLLFFIILFVAFFWGYWCGRDVESNRLAHIVDAEYDRWLTHGMMHGWVSEPYCDTHEGPLLRDWEADEFEDGSDPCVLTIRVWKDGYEDVVNDYLREIEGRP